MEAALISDADVPFCAVIGAGPAGLFAADALARAGARVAIYEHKPSPARKFLMAGRGGLNITHSENLDRFISRYGAAAAHIAPVHPRLSAAGAARFLRRARRGDLRRLQRPGFPGELQGFAAAARLARAAGRLGVTIADAPCLRGLRRRGRAAAASAPTAANPSVHVDAVVLALGGASWPRLGSDGAWATRLGGAGRRA